MFASLIFLIKFLLEKACGIIQFMISDSEQVAVYEPLLSLARIELPMEVLLVYSKLLRSTLMDAIDGQTGLLKTGDIDASWIRDSAQIAEAYMTFPGDESIKCSIYNLIVALAERIAIDPYANAYKTSTSVTPLMAAFDGGKASGLAGGNALRSREIVFERKWEVDSPAYFIRLVRIYAGKYGMDVYTPAVKDTLKIIVRTYKSELGEGAGYFFKRGSIDTRHFRRERSLGVWGPFGPSDDVYGAYLTASNFFAAQELLYLTRARAIDEDVILDARYVYENIVDGINNFGICYHPGFGKIYAAAINNGIPMFFDDPNLPNLLDLPIFAPDMIDPGIYENTARFITSSANPNMRKYEGFPALTSIHTPGKIWPMSIIARGLLSEDKGEILTILVLIGKLAHPATGNIPESFDPSDPFNMKRQTRTKSFLWCNSMYIQLVNKYLELSSK